jgi:hypothetical protein
MSSNINKDPKNPYTFNPFSLQPLDNANLQVINFRNYGDFVTASNIASKINKSNTFSKQEELKNTKVKNLNINDNSFSKIQITKILNNSADLPLPNQSLQEVNFGNQEGLNDASEQNFYKVQKKVTNIQQKSAVFLNDWNSLDENKQNEIKKRNSELKNLANLAFYSNIAIDSSDNENNNSSKSTESTNSSNFTSDPFSDKKRKKSKTDSADFKNKPNEDSFTNQNLYFYQQYETQTMRDKERLTKYFEEQKQFDEQKQIEEIKKIWQEFKNTKEFYENSLEERGMNKIYKGDPFKIKTTNQNNL